MISDCKLIALGAAAVCLSLFNPAMAQRGGERGGGPPGMHGRSIGPGPSGPSFGGSSPQRYNAPPSRSHFAGPSHSPYPAGSPGAAPGRPSYSPVPSTRFGTSPEPSGFHRGAPPSAGGPSAPAQYERMRQAPDMRRQPDQRYMPGPADTSRMQQALRQGDYEAIGRESRGIRNSAERIDRLGSDLPVQDRLKLPLINKMYRQGTDLVDEGRSKQDESKIRMGIQQINEANEKLHRLEGTIENHGGKGRSERGNGNRQSR